MEIKEAEPSLVCGKAPSRHSSSGDAFSVRGPAPLPHAQRWPCLVVLCSWLVMAVWTALTIIQCYWNPLILPKLIYNSSHHMHHMWLKVHSVPAKRNVKFTVFMFKTCISASGVLHAVMCNTLQKSVLQQALNSGLHYTKLKFQLSLDLFVGMKSLQP